MASTTTRIQVAKSNQLPVEFLDEIAQAGQEYQETLTKDDMSIPFIQILQQLSPQCTKGKPEYIKGAEPSDLFNTVTQQVFKSRDENNNPIEAMRILPIFYKRSFIEWVPRSKGGGIVKEYSVEDGLSIITKRSENNLDIIQVGSPLGTPGNQLNDTHTHFCFQVNNDGTWTPVILTMTSTQIKPSKDLNNLVSNVKLPDGRKAPRFFGIYSVTTQQRTNDQGSWYVWKFEKVSDVLEAGMMDMFRDAKAFLEGIKSGEHKADYSKMESEVNPEAVKNLDEVPF
jgi:hypothetical protein